MATTDSRQRRTEYDNNASDAECIPFVQVKGGDAGRSTVVGEGAEVSVEVEDGELRATITAEVEAADRLLGRDVVSVILSAKDLPEPTAPNDH